MSFARHKAIDLIRAKTRLSQFTSDRAGPLPGIFLDVEFPLQKILTPMSEIVGLLMLVCEFAKRLIKVRVSSNRRSTRRSPFGKEEVKTKLKCRELNRLSVYKNLPAIGVQAHFKIMIDIQNPIANLSDQARITPRGTFQVPMKKISERNKRNFGQTQTGIAGRNKLSGIGMQNFGRPTGEQKMWHSIKGRIDKNMRQTILSAPEKRHDRMQKRSCGFPTTGKRCDDRPLFIIRQAANNFTQRFRNNPVIRLAPNIVQLRRAISRRKSTNRIADVAELEPSFHRNPAFLQRDQESLPTALIK